uniref:FGE-sulfatase domain-containing protein n=1 Tax=Globodera pallida TaxID=36090 RepID=A0A183CBF9_GLOPA
MLSIFREKNNGGSSHLSTAFIGLFLAALFVARTAGQSDSSTAIEYEIVLPVSAADMSIGPRAWQGEWVRRFSPRVVQNGWKYRTAPRNDFGAHRIVMEKKWSPLEPSIRFL